VGHLKQDSSKYSCQINCFHLNVNDTDNGNVTIIITLVCIQVVQLQLSLAHLLDRSQSVMC